MTEKNNWHKRFLPKWVISAMLLFVCVGISQAQKNQNSPELPKTTRDCEEWIRFADESLVKWNENKDTTLIVIVRLGGSESSHRLNQKRIKILKEYIAYRNKDTKVVFAEGDRAEADTGGTVEIYIAGKLYDSLAVPPGSEIPLKNCNP